MAPASNQEETPRVPNEVQEAIHRHCTQPKELEVTFTMWLVAQDSWEEDSGVKLEHYNEFLATTGDDVSDTAQEAILEAARQAFEN